MPEQPGNLGVMDKTFVFTLLFALWFTVLLAQSDFPGPVPQTTTMTGGPVAAVPFEIDPLKRNWRRRIEAMRSSQRFPLIDVESSFNVSTFNPSANAKEMDQNGIALIAFSAQGQGWSDDARVILAIDPWRYIPTTTAGIPPAWPHDGGRRYWLDVTGR